MAKVETSVTELKINKLTKAQYDAITSPSNTELYFIKDEAIDYSDIINTPNLSTVALSGSYLDLINKPIVPTTTDDLLENSPAAITSGGAYKNLVSSVTQTGTSDRFTVVKNGNNTSIVINNVANAVTASKLGTTNVGSNITPIYLNNGTATPINYTIAKSVPADAKFTDTTYNIFTGATSSTAGTSGLVKKPSAGDQNKFLKGDGNWAVVDSFPSQSGNAGKYLTTNGTSVSWDALADVANSGSYNDLTDKPEVDQSYNSTSSNAQSGKAVAEAISTKQDTITGAATTVTSNNLTANRTLISNGSGKIAISTTTSTELGYVHGVTSAIQTQLNNKQATLVSGTNIKTVNNNSLLGSGNITIDSLPSQTGNSGKYLTTNGTTASWVAIEEYTASEVETLWNSI